MWGQLVRRTNTTPTYAISSYAVSDLSTVKNKYGMTLLKRAPKSSLRVRKSKQTKVAEKYCWAIAQAVGRSRCGRSGSSVLEFGFQLESHVHTYTFDYLRTQLQLESDLPVRDYCVSRGKCLYYLNEMSETLFPRINFSIRGLSILNISRTGCVALM